MRYFWMATQTSHCLDYSKTFFSFQKEKWENSNSFLLCLIPKMSTNFFVFQVYHYCHFDGRQDSFLCPRGTMFNQEVFVCDWWYNVNCESSEVFYSLNDNLYKVRKISTIYLLFSVICSTTFVNDCSSKNEDTVAFSHSHLGLHLSFVL